MPKLRKDEVADLDVAVLDETEYTETEYDSYEGEIPPTNTELTGFVRQMWWCRTAEKDDGTGLDPMIKVLWIAADNEGDNEDYNGLPVVENLVLIPGAKFRWAPFLRTFGITLKAIKNSTFVADEDDERWGGAPIEKIGTFVPGEESDGAWSRLITGRRFWNDNWNATAKKWLPWETDNGQDPEAEADSEVDAETETEEEPEIFEDDDGNLVNADGEYVDESGELVDEPVSAQEEEAEEEPEPEPEPARPARARRTAAKPAAAKPAATGRPARAAATAAKPAARRTAAKPAAAATSSRGRRPAAAATAAKPAATGRGRKAKADNEPPF